MLGLDVLFFYRDRMWAKKQRSRILSKFEANKRAMDSLRSFYYSFCAIPYNLQFQIVDLRDISHFCNSLCSLILNF